MRGQGQEGRPGRALLGTEEPAERLGVDRVTVWRWCKEGRIPCLKIGRLWRVRGESLESLLKEAEGSERARSPGRRTPGKVPYTYPGA